MLFLAWRQMMARKKQTLLILLGISLGTLLYVSISGVQLGTRQYISDQLLNNTAHVLISGAENNIDFDDVTQRFYNHEALVAWARPPIGKRDNSKLENYLGWADRLQADPEVFDFSPRLSTNALLSFGKFTSTVNLVGVVPERQIRITPIEDYMTKGHFADLKGGANKIVLAQGVVDNLGVMPGQYINVTVGTGSTQPFKLVGVVSFGNHNIDDSMAFAHLTNVQTLNRTPGRVTDIAVALVDIEKSAEKANLWKLMSSDKVEDWQEANKMFMEMINMQDFVRYFITTAILIVAAFGVYNVLSIMINQKQKEIAILRAIGYAPGRILELVLYQGIILGFSGGLLGIFMGFLMCRWVESIDLGFKFGKSNHMLISYDPSIYWIAFIAAMMASILASYLPARAASHMTPMDIIRSQS